MQLTYKICTIDDLNILVEKAKNTFVDAFEKYNDPNDFDNYLESAFSEDAIKNELLNPNSTFYFVYFKTELVGYFKLNLKDAQHEQFDLPSMELERIYVLKEFQGQRIGEQILLEIIDLAKLKKINFIWLGVWQENKSAVRFYERFGFKIFDSHPYYIGKDKQIDWLMKYELTTNNK